MPKDISFSKNTAKIRFNFTGNNQEHYLGSVTSIFLKPGPPSMDVEGPIITYETDTGRNLRSGDHINENTAVKIRFSDPSGINITGKKGHELIIKDQLSNRESNISKLFNYDVNSITTGTYNFLQSDDNNSINIMVSAWDNANNPSESSIQLSIVNSDAIELKNVLNFPNPFSESTQFTFELTSSAEVEILIFTLAGLKVRTIIPNYFEQGFNRVIWDGRDNYGQLLANGAYIYQLKAKNDFNETNYIGKLAIIR